MVGLVLFLAIMVVGVRSLRTAHGERELWLTVLEVWMFGGLLHNWEITTATWVMLRPDRGVGRCKAYLR